MNEDSEIQGSGHQGEASLGAAAALGRVTPDPKLPGACEVLVRELEKIHAKCRPGYMVSKFVRGWIGDALAIACAIEHSIKTPMPASCAHPSWEPAPHAKVRCLLCGVVGDELRYLKPDAARTPAGPAA